MASKKKSPKDWRKTEDYQTLRDEVVAQLEKVQVIDAITLSRVEEYMDFWVLRHQLQDDISARGLYVTDERGRTTENRSVSLSIQASRQMGAIGASLGLTMGAERSTEEDEL